MAVSGTSDRARWVKPVSLEHIIPSCLLPSCRAGHALLALVAIPSSQVTSLTSCFGVSGSPTFENLRFCGTAVGQREGWGGMNEVHVFALVTIEWVQSAIWQSRLTKAPQETRGGRCRNCRKCRSEMVNSLAIFLFHRCCTCETIHITINP